MQGKLDIYSKFRIRRFADDEAHRQDKPYSVSEFEGNLGLREGIAEAWLLITGLGGTAFSEANAQTGVGESATGAQDTDTDLLGASKTYKAMDTGHPHVKGSGADAKVYVFQSTYGSGDANNAWNEFIVRNGAVGLKDLIRKVSAQGTKTSGQTWELTVELTIA